MIGQTFGRFKIIEKIGEGKMAEVYKAYDEFAKRFGAVKIFRPETVENLADWAHFVDDARMISSLNHPHICDIYDINQDDKHYYIIMELLQGETLAQRLRRGRFPIGEVCKIGRQIAHALDHAHRYKIVHGNLRPANIFLTGRGVKITDFGVVRLKLPLRQDLLQVVGPRQLAGDPEGNLPGPPEYMSPEQLDGRPIDVRSDIYSFGSILFHMAIGLPIFSAGTRSHVVNWVRTMEPPRASDLRKMPEALGRIIDGCLRLDPDDRFQSVSQIREEFDDPNLKQEEDAFEASLQANKRASKLGWFDRLLGRKAS